MLIHVYLCIDSISILLGAEIGILVNHQIYNLVDPKVIFCLNIACNFILTVSFTYSIEHYDFT